MGGQSDRTGSDETSRYSPAMKAARAVIYTLRRVIVQFVCPAFESDLAEWKGVLDRKKVDGEKVDDKGLNKTSYQQKMSPPSRHCPVHRTSAMQALVLTCPACAQV